MTYRRKIWPKSDKIFPNFRPFFAVIMPLWQGDYTSGTVANWSDVQVAQNTLARVVCQAPHSVSATELRR